MVRARNGRRPFTVAAVFSLIAAVLVSAPAAAQTVNPSFTVEIVDERAWGDNFPADTSLTFTRGLDDWVTTTDGTGHFDLDLQPYDMAVGDYITVTAGAVSKDHTVTSLAITAIDPDTDTVTGTADAGTFVWVDVNDGQGDSGRTVTASGAGDWSADFSVPGDGGGTHDLQLGTDGWALQSDADEDRTQVGWRVPNPIITVDAHTDGVWGDHWPNGAAVTVTIAAANWNATTDSNGNFWLDLRPFDLQVGQTVEADDGTFTKDHVVLGLAVTGADVGTNVVSGTADSGSSVWVDVHGQPDVGRTVTADGAGNWSADLDDLGDGGGTYDLVPGSSGYTGQYDADNDATNADWRVPDPQISVAPVPGSIWAQDFQPNDSITITIDSVVAGTYPTDEWGNFDGNNYGLTFSVPPGSHVVVDDGVSTKDHFVTSLAVTDVDEAANTVTGTADPGDIIDVWDHGSGESLQVVACDDTNGPACNGDPEGTWHADFTGLLDFQPGTDGNSGERDPDGDTTYAFWRLPNPRFEVDPASGQMWGNEWVANGSVTITIDTVVSGPFPTDEWGNFNSNSFGVSIDFAAGVTVTVSDGETTKDHIVTGLAVTDVDETTNTVSGSAAAGSGVEVWVHGFNAWRHETADASGLWSADFNVPGDEPGEAETADLVAGSNGNSSQCDGDDDCTQGSWNIPNPQFQVDPAFGQMWGNEWAANGSVMVTIDGVGSGPFPTDEWGNFDSGSSTFDFAAGDSVTVSDGTTLKDHTVTYLTVTDVDEGLNVVSGTAAAGSGVDVWVHGDGTSVNATAESNGDWSADFTGLVDFQPGTGGAANQCDPDGDCTQINWNILDPRITAAVIHEEVWATGFPNDPSGQVLYYRLYDPVTLDVDFEGDMPLIVNVWGTEAGDRSFGRYDVRPGQALTVRNRPFDEPLDGGVERTLAISHIEVTTIDSTADTLSGIADPAEGGYVCVQSHDAQLCSTDPGFTWNPDNTFEADFAVIGSDVRPGHWNSASQFEADGDETHFWWNLPPWVVVELAEEDASGNPRWPDAVRAEQWAGPVVTLTINSSFVADWTVIGDGQYTFELPGIDIDPGDIVTLTDSVDTKTVVVEPLSIDQINFADDTPPNSVEGTAVPQRNIRVETRATVGGWWAERWVNADLLGDWRADFGVPGNGWREQWTAEFGGAEGLGRHMRVEVYDEDNDRVETRTCEGQPRIEVARSDGRVDAIDFPEGSTVTLEIDDPSTAGVDYTDTAIAVQNPDEPCETIAVFDLGGFQVPDDAVVSADDGAGTTVTHNVISFSIDNADPNTDTVSGTAPAGAEVLVEADGNWRYVVACDNTAEYPCDTAPEGTWLADFSTPGAEPGEEQVVDLGPGSSGRAIMLDAIGNTTELSWRISASSFQVDPSAENLWGSEFEPNGSVTVTVNNTTVPGTPFGADEGGNFNVGFDPNQLDLVAGDHIEFDDGTTLKAHDVTSLTVTGADPDSNVVSGTAVANSEVWVDLHGQGGAGRIVTADGSGAWSTDFDVPGDGGGTYDFGPGDGGYASQCDDDNDCTWINWDIANPNFQVDPLTENLWGNEFAPNSAVTVTVGGIAVPGSPFGTDEGGNFNVGFDPNQLDLQAGDHIEFNDGTTLKAHTVTGVTVTGVDPDSNVVSGTAAADSEVQLWVHEHGATVLAIADSNGDWSANFSGVFDLVSGTGGAAQQCDPDNDCTQINWDITNPNFQVDPFSENLWGNEFAPNAAVAVTVNGTAVPGSPFRADEGGNFNVGFDPNQLDLVAGDHIEFDDGVTLKAHDVTGLTVIGVDSDSNVISGTAVANSEVWVDIHGQGGAGRTVTADGSGNWSTDFGVPGDGGGTYDIAPGDAGYASQCDPDNDCTQVNWRIPAASFYVDPFTENLWGNEFAPNSAVTVTVNNTTVPGSPFGTDEGGNFNVGFDPNQLDILAGDHIEFNDGTTLKTHDVTGLTVTGIDPGSNVVSGTAAAGSDVQLWVHGGGTSVFVTADVVTGAWSADLSNVMDLVAGTGGAAQQCDVDNDCTQVNWRIPSSNFQVDPLSENLWGNEFAPNIAVTVTVNNTTVPGSPFNTDEGGNFNVEFDPNQLDIMAGDHIEFDDGVTLKAHDVTSLTVSGVDTDTDIVSGTADPGTEVDVWVHDSSAWRHLTAGPDRGDGVGEWSADFGNLGDEPGEEETINLEPGSNGNSSQCDPDGDCTQINWDIANPNFQVNPAFGQMWANGWTPNSSLTVTVNGEPAGSVATDEGGNFDSNESGVSFAFAAGDVVVVSDEVSSKTHIVTSLTVTGVDPDTNTVWGTAAADSEVQLWVHEHGATVLATANSNGDWSANFSGVFDLVSGTGGAAQQCDPDSDCTQINWDIVQPQFQVDPANDQMWGSQWAPNGSVTVTVNGEPVGSVDTNEWGDLDSNESGVTFGFAVGALVVVSDGVSTKDHTVTSLTVTGADPDADTVWGTAAADSEVQLWVHEHGSTVLATADSNGDWSADFSGVFDLVSGTGGAAQQCDLDSDCTQINWDIVQPQFQVDPRFGQIWGNQWAPNGSVTVTVNGEPAGSVATNDWGDFDSNESGATFDFTIGALVVVSDGFSIKDHTVTNLTITGGNPETNTVSGTAVPGSNVDVWVHDSNAWRHETADESGLWFANFGVPGDEPGEEDTVNLEIGSNGNSSQCDDDNDCTMGGWEITNPRFTANPDGDGVWGEEWAANTQVIVTFDDDDDATNGVLTTAFADTDEGGHFDLDLWEVFDVQPGQYVVVTDGSSTKAHWVTGLQVTEVDPAADTVSGTAEPGAEITVAVNTSSEGLVWEHLTFQFGPDNRNTDSLNEHLKFRQAVAHALDRQAIVDAVPNGGYIIDSYVDAFLPELSQGAWAQYNYDPILAAQLITQLCADLGRDCVANPPVAVFSTTSNNDSRVVLSTLIGPMLEAAGIDVVLDLEDSSIFFGDTFNGGTWDLGEWAWVGEPDPWALADHHRYIDPSNEGENYYNWGTPDSSIVNAATARMAELVVLMNGAADETELVAYIQEAEQILADEVVFIPLYVRSDPIDVGGESVYRVVVAGEDGDWTADFSAPWEDQSEWDIEPGTSGSAEEYDIDGDATLVDWMVETGPELQVQANLTEDGFGGHGWTPEATVTATVFDSDGISVLLPLVGVPTDGEGSFWLGFDELLDLPDGLMPGMWITVVDDVDPGLTHTLELVEVRFDSFDPGTSTVDGSAPSLPIGEVRLHLFDRSGNPLDDGTGNPIPLWPDGPSWSLDLSTNDPPHTPEGLLDAIVEVPDEDNDGTFATLPAIRAWAGWTADDGWFGSDHFDDDTSVTATIYDTAGGTQVMPPTIIAVTTRGEFGLEVPLEAGNEIVVVGNVTGVEKRLVVDPVTVEVFDHDADVVEGTAAPDAVIRIEVGDEFDGRDLLIRPDGFGNWRADFGSEGFDLNADMGGRVSAVDLDTDSTNAGIDLRPIMTSIDMPLDLIQVGDSASLTATFTDMEVPDTHTATIDWGDGTDCGALPQACDGVVVYDAGPASNGTATASHTYSETGVYTVTVTVTDGHGASDTTEYRYVVVYDPTGGFATGGGWIELGGPTADPSDVLPPGVSVGEKARFGFTVKYKKSGDTPQGNLNAKLGSLHLQSEVFEWMVITVTVADTAWFRGVATIDGEAHEFLVEAVDGDAFGEPDRITIRLWSEGADIYNDDPLYQISGDLSGGKIQIHRNGPTAT